MCEHTLSLLNEVTVVGNEQMYCGLLFRVRFGLELGKYSRSYCWPEDVASVLGLSVKTCTAVSTLSFSIIVSSLNYHFCTNKKLGQDNSHIGKYR